MMEIFSTLIRGVGARHKNTITGQYAIELIDQKTREAEQSLQAAKSILAGLIARERQEKRNLDMVRTRISDLEKRTKLALKDSNEELATEAAKVIAELENEAEVREQTLAMVRSRITRLRFSVEKTHRRLIDLKQGVIAARAMRADHKAHRGLRASGHTNSIQDAEALVARVLEEQNPSETSEILDEIEGDLGGDTLREKMADAGYGAPIKIRAEDVLARLKMS